MEVKLSGGAPGPNYNVSTLEALTLIKTNAAEAMKHFKAGHGDLMANYVTSILELSGVVLSGTSQTVAVATEGSGN